MELFIFIFINFLLYFSCVKVINFIKKDISFADNLISAFLFHLFSLFFIFSIFGYLHLIDFKFLLLFYFMFIVIYSLIGGNVKKGYREIFLRFVEKFKEFIKILKENPYLNLIFILFLIQLIFILRFIFLYPPQGWDSYAYHLPVASRIVIEKGMPSFDNFLKAHTFFMFPKNIEYIFSLYYIFIGSDKGMMIIHIPFLIFGIIACYSILRKLGASKERSLFVFCLLFTPIIPQQLGVAYVDIEVNMMFIIFMNFALIENPYFTLFSLIALSIGAGIKLSIFPFFIIYLFVSIIKFIRRRKIIFLILSFIIIYITSTHYYLFNYIKTGNPFYPLKINIFGFEIFEGKINPFTIDPRFWIFNPFFIIKKWLEFPYGNVSIYKHDNLSAGFGHLFISFSFLSLFLNLISLKKNKNWKKFYFFFNILFNNALQMVFKIYHIYSIFIFHMFYISMGNT